MAVSGILASIAEFAVQVISMLGYPGIFFLMALESMMTPVASEMVMPFAGFLAAQGRLNFVLVVLIGGLGCLAGSIGSYYIGYYGGIPLVKKFGKYFFLNEGELAWTERFFKKSGEKTIFIARFIPVVRHLISIPAGIAKMDIKKFCIYTFAGSTIWCFILAYLGYVFYQNWTKVREALNLLDIPVIILIAIGIIAYVLVHLKKNAKRKKIIGKGKI